MLLYYTLKCLRCLNIIFPLKLKLLLKFVFNYCSLVSCSIYASYILYIYHVESFCNYITTVIISLLAQSVTSNKFYLRIHTLTLPNSSMYSLPIFIFCNRACLQRKNIHFSLRSNFRSNIEETAHADSKMK